MSIVLMDGWSRVGWGAVGPRRAGDARSSAMVPGRPAALSVLVPSANRGTSLFIPLPFGEVKRQRVLLWVLIYINNLLTLSVAANRDFFCGFFSVCLRPYFRGTTQDCMELTDTY